MKVCVCGVSESNTSLKSCICYKLFSSFNNIISNNKNMLGLASKNTFESILSSRNTKLYIEKFICILLYLFYIIMGL